MNIESSLGRCAKAHSEYFEMEASDSMLLIPWWEQNCCATAALVGLVSFNLSVFNVELFASALPFNSQFFPHSFLSAWVGEKNWEIGFKKNLDAKKIQLVKRILDGNKMNWNDQCVEIKITFTLLHVAILQRVTGVLFNTSQGS